MSIPANELVQWYARAKRELPWRATGVSAWQILVSEFMLQQTPVARVVARAIGGKAEAGNPSTVRDHADVAALLPDDATAAEFSAALMELGATVCTARAPKCGICPLTACAWRDAGYPAGDGPPRPSQRYAGTDRQVRGKLLDVLRGSSVPVPRTHLDVVWLTDTAQRDRALDSLLVDGLVEQTADGRFALAGEGDDARP